MSSIKKALMASSGGAGLDVDEVFSTYLYTGNATAGTKITTGIDLETEGGLLWTKKRSASADHYLWDSINAFDGATSTTYASKRLKSNEADPKGAEGNALMSFETDGFVVSTNGAINGSGSTYASWTFRKAPKFFDVVTYTGNGTAGRTVSHNLGSVPGMIIVKRTNSGADWTVYHRGVASDAETDAVFLNTKSAAGDHPSYWNDTAPTDTVFSVGNGSEVNSGSGTYVAYLFAHNDGDGEFGPDGGQDIIKCGSFTVSSGATDEINLGFEPQFVIVKKASSTGGWLMGDVMRGAALTDYSYLQANSSAAESTLTGGNFYATSTGFHYESLGAAGSEVIYMAIRRGSLFPPEAATEVFGMYQISGANTLPTFLSPNGVDPANETLPIDFAFYKDTTGTEDWWTGARLIQPKALRLNTMDDEVSTVGQQFDFRNGWGTNQIGSATQYRSWMWKRAPGYLDVVPYKGNGTAGRTVSHNLGVVPEMMWVKKRSGGTDRNWYVYHSGNYDQGAGNGAAYGYEILNSTDGYTDATFAWNDTAPTKSVFSLGNIATNDNGNYFLAVLFATTAGVSKVGRYTGNGSSQTIDCGFSSGARLILIKRANTVGDWYLWDTESGIVSGTDYHLSLNTGAGQAGDDSVDPASSGFAVNQGATNINVSSSVYIFYAVA